MIQLKANKARSKYKNTEAWLDAVYRKNKFVIDKTFIPSSQSGKSIKAQFKQSVRDYMDYFGPEKALKAATKSAHFTTPKERIRENLLSGLKKDQDTYKRFQQLTRGSKGRFEKFDPEKLFYHFRDKVYVYDNRVIISFENSPQRVTVREMSSQERQIRSNQQNKILNEYFDQQMKEIEQVINR